MSEESSLAELISKLCLISALSGHEDDVRKFLKNEMKSMNLDFFTDRLGNLGCTIKGNER